MTQFNIEISKTSNPDILKFTADSFLTRSSSHEFKNIDDAKSSPLAQELFYLPFVKTVYISQNFIAIEKYDIIAWEDVQEEVASSISEYLNSGRPAITDFTVSKKIPTTVYAESTPNPAVMKFVANMTLVKAAYEYKDSYEAIQSPLARALFNFPFVKEVFINTNHVSVMKYEVVDWADIVMEIREFIRKFLQDGKTVLNEDLNINGSGDSFSALETAQKTRTGIEKKIIAILEEYVEPAVANDGGQIVLDSFNEDTKVVKVILKGACSGCPSSTVTLKSGIETILKQMLPGEINTVEAVNG
ncbi:NifU family protein [Aequorivita sp. H23M31]|uniref:NifU family protein n=1 Tax=Aequorivita ciconiae TaxID=2494375 RepID=A0A410G3V6_9FLAO|nr:NifU family protein [Aequorivita sp. H23M31]QAA81919.1 NifU family protein [Aequorivita sp. H23M31]